MAYCGPRGIPLSVFLGRAVGPSDPQWLPDDRDAALGWAEFEGRRCKNCGTHPEEWADDKYAYHAHLTECIGCRQQQRRAEQDDAKEGHGRYAAMASGSAADCPRCKPAGT
ncbi:MAG: hypothetical protein HOV83_22160 [Catenulispora sp.]|nr:hypothetical protein [Catenulispora sp.]